MEFNFFGMNLELWKLHSVSDYARFFFFLTAGVLVFVVWTKRIGKRRNDAAATARVVRKLRRLCKREGVCGAAPPAVPPGTADALLVSQRGIFALRCIGWGIRVFGSIGSPQWRVEDTREKRIIPNPLAQAGAAAAALSARLAEKGLNAEVRPLTVFADPFDSPRLSLEGGASAIAYEDLKKWYHSQPELPDMDRSARNAVIQALASADSEKERRS